MEKRKTVLLPSSRKVLQELGENIRLARLRRKLSAEQVAERADISRQTLVKIESGASSVAMGSYCQVLFVLGLDKDLLKVASDDILGRKLQDAELVVKERAPKRKKKS
ncbi:MAG TPA: helix-turn-helix transcriptional regulator [Cytophagaceae bacterium]|jgi:transcriptional regulator with XRE-family HTH domain|nr:helix-turn-helix transcriptional regulator [Cytophagaceae bacterium]